MSWEERIVFGSWSEEQVSQLYQFGKVINVGTG